MTVATKKDRKSDLHGSKRKIRRKERNQDIIEQKQYDGNV